MPARDVIRRRRIRRRDQYNRRRGAHPRPQDDEQQEQPMPPPPPPPPPLPPLPLLWRHQVINLFVARCLANIRKLLKEMNDTMPGASDDLHDWGTEWLEAIPPGQRGPHDVGLRPVRQAPVHRAAQPFPMAPGRVRLREQHRVGHGPGRPAQGQAAGCGPAVADGQAALGQRSTLRSGCRTTVQLVDLSPEE
ncbi:hypothetical protein PG995_012237 [Apiospora arundinis]